MSVQIKAILFIVATVGLAWVSRASLGRPRSHGFHRFFAWEAITVLVLLNLEVWYKEPFSFHQLVSWFLLFTSLFLVIHGVWLLRRLGKADRKREEGALLEFEKTTELVTVGAYRYIRHPLYSSLLFLAWRRPGLYRHPLSGFHRQDRGGGEYPLFWRRLSSLYAPDQDVCANLF